MTSPKDPPEGIKNMRNYLGLPPTDPKDPQAEAFKQVNEALNNAKVPTEDRQVMDADDPRVFNPLAAQTDIGEVISGILENFRVRTLEKQDKGNKRDTTKALLALFQAHQQELLRELKNHREFVYWGDGAPSDLDKYLNDKIGELNG